MKLGRLHLDPPRALASGILGAAILCLLTDHALYAIVDALVAIAVKKVWIEP